MLCAKYQMSNMRDHMKALNKILTSMPSGGFERAADVAENRHGMSSLESHGAIHMARFMPEGICKKKRVCLLTRHLIQCGIQVTGKQIRCWQKYLADT
jgi:hypothetical protein